MNTSKWNVQQLSAVSWFEENSAFLQVKSLFAGIPSQPLTSEDIEAFISNEFNRLAAIFSQVLGSESGPATLQVASLLRQGQKPLQEKMKPL